MARKAKLAPESLYDLDWQRREYERLMGEEAAERQELAARLERGQCVCRRRTVKTDGGFLRIHDRDCPRFRPWMEEHLDNVRPKTYTHTTTTVPDENVGQREETT